MGIELLDGHVVDHAFHAVYVAYEFGDQVLFGGSPGRATYRYHAAFRRDVGVESAGGRVIKFSFVVWGVFPPVFDTVISFFTFLTPFTSLAYLVVSSFCAWLWASPFNVTFPLLGNLRLVDVHVAMEDERVFHLHPAPRIRLLGGTIPRYLDAIVHAFAPGQRLGGVLGHQFVGLVKHRT